MYRWGEKKSLLPCNLFEIGKTNMGDGADIEFLLFKMYMVNRCGPWLL